MELVLLPDVLSKSNSESSLKYGFDIAIKNEVVVKDLKKYSEILRKLRDHRNAVPAKNSLYGSDFQNMSPEDILKEGYEIKYEGNYINIYKDVCTYYGMEEHLEDSFYNSKGEILKLLEGLKPADNLYLKEVDHYIKLSSLLDSHSIDFIDKIFNILKESKLSKEEQKGLLLELSENIIYFATEILSCIELVPLEIINIEQLNKECEMYSDMYYNESDPDLCKEYSDEMYKRNIILSSLYDMESNHQIFTLAKKINGYFN